MLVQQQQQQQCSSDYHYTTSSTSILVIKINSRLVQGVVCVGVSVASVFFFEDRVVSVATAAVSQTGGCCAVCLSVCVCLSVWFGRRCGAVGSSCSSTPPPNSLVCCAAGPAIPVMQHRQSHFCRRQKTGLDSTSRLSWLPWVEARC